MSSAEISHTQPRRTPTPESPVTSYLPVNASGDSGPEANRRRGDSDAMDSGNAGRES